MDKVLMLDGDYLSLQFSDMAKEETTPKPVMIAMKGHPGTGKSTLAHSLASTLKIPLIDKDDIRDCTLLLHQSLPSASYSLLNDLSYHAIYQIASTQLRLGLSVVIDSPLSRPTHLQRLLHIASSAGAHLVILECKPSDEAKWRERLERRGKSEGASWHKPATWQELEMLVQGYGGCTDYDVGDVPRMVVDTTAPVSVEEHVSRVINFIVSRCGTCVGL